MPSFPKNVSGNPYLEGMVFTGSVCQIHAFTTQASQGCKRQAVLGQRVWPGCGDGRTGSLLYVGQELALPSPLAHERLPGLFIPV